MLDHLEIVSAYIEEELGQRNISLVGQLEDAKHLDIHISLLGAIPKKGRPGKWKLIMDLSSPEGHSINDGIAKEDCSFHCTSVDWAVQWTTQLGQHPQLAKIDMRKTYCNIPIAPTDRHLLGFTWGEKVYVDKVLPFSLRSAPLIFSAIADGRKAANKRDLLSLIGTLAHASKVIQSSRIFLRRLINLSTTTSKSEPFHSPKCKSQIRHRVVVLVHEQMEWYLDASVTEFAISRTCCGRLRKFGLQSLLGPGMVSVEVVSNASRGTHIGKGVDINRTSDSNMGKTLEVWEGTDNATTVEAINSHSSRLKDSGHLFRCLAFLMAYYQCRIM